MSLSMQLEIQLDCTRTAVIPGKFWWPGVARWQVQGNGYKGLHDATCSLKTSRSFVRWLMSMK